MPLQHYQAAPQREGQKGGAVYEGVARAAGQQGVGLPGSRAGWGRSEGRVTRTGPAIRLTSYNRSVGVLLSGQVGILVHCPQALVLASKVDGDWHL